MSTGKIALVLSMVAGVWGFFALWAWALFGMSDRIATAHGWTVGGLLTVAFMTFLFGVAD